MHLKISLRATTSVRKREILLLLVFLLFFLIHPSASHSFCFKEAGNKYGIDPLLLWSIAKVESNFNPSAFNRNKNGSFDYGVMQINSWWYKKIGKNLWNDLGNPCTNIKVGAWILTQCIQRYNYNWEAVGCYNAVSKSKRKRYAKKIYHVYKKFMK
jgi:soluble lytic murein transglycosylase-like protein